MNIGPALKYLRNKKGLTLDEVANSLNKRVAKEDIDDIKFNKGKISKWENGKEEPKISALKYVADFYVILSIYAFKLFKANLRSFNT